MRGFVARVKAKVGIHRLRMHDFSGIEQAFGIPDGFDALEQVDHLPTKHAFEVRSADASVAVFTA